ncbi:MAG TPA: DUF1559 domain-containing protein [Pirellulales bacterium]
MIARSSPARFCLAATFRFVVACLSVALLLGSSVGCESKPAKKVAKKTTAGGKPSRPAEGEEPHTPFPVGGAEANWEPGDGTIDAPLGPRRRPDRAGQTSPDRQRPATVAAAPIEAYRAEPGLPSWLGSLLQPEHFGVVMIRAAQIRETLSKNDAWAQVLKLVRRIGPDGPRYVEDLDDREAGEFVVVFGATQPLLIIRFTGPHTPEQAAEYFRSHQAREGWLPHSEVFGGRKVLTDLPPDEPSRFSAPARTLLDDRTILIALPDETRRLLARLGEGDSAALATAAAGLTGEELVAAVALREPAERVLTQLKDVVSLGPLEQTFRALNSLESAAFALHAAPFEATLTLQAPDAESAAQATPQIEEIAKLPDALWQGGRRGITEGRNADLALAKPFVGLIDELIESIETKTEGSSVLVSAGVASSANEVAGKVVRAIEEFQVEATAAKAVATPADNLRTVILSAHLFHNLNKQLPHTGAFHGKSRLSGLSWRVAVLPCLEHEDLYEKFKLDEPWDSEHNKKLIAEMPAIFRVPGVELEPGRTMIVQAVGPETALPLDRPAGIPDQNAVLFVQADPSKAVIWTKPDDLVVDPHTPALDDLYRGATGYLLGRFNGNVDSVQSLDAEQWRALFDFPAKAP